MDTNIYTKIATQAIKNCLRMRTSGLKLSSHERTEYTSHSSGGAAGGLYCREDDESDF